MLFLNAKNAAMLSKKAVQRFNFRPEQSFDSVDSLMFVSFSTSRFEASVTWHLPMNRNG